VPLLTSAAEAISSTVVSCIPWVKNTDRAALRIDARLSSRSRSRLIWVFETATVQCANRWSDIDCWSVGDYRSLYSQRHRFVNIGIFFTSAAGSWCAKFRADSQARLQIHRLLRKDFRCIGVMLWPGALRAKQRGRSVYPSVRMGCYIYQGEGPTRYQRRTVAGEARDCLPQFRDSRSEWRNNIPCRGSSSKDAVTLDRFRWPRAPSGCGRRACACPP